MSDRRAVREMRAAGVAVSGGGPPRLGLGLAEGEPNLHPDPKLYPGAVVGHPG